MIVVADRLPASVRPGEALTVDVHVVSDLRVDLRGLECTATLSWPGGAHRWRFAGDVAADSCVRVGSLQVEAPDVDGRRRASCSSSRCTGAGAGGRPTTTGRL